MLAGCRKSPTLIRQLAYFFCLRPSDCTCTGKRDLDLSASVLDSLLSGAAKKYVGIE